MKSEQEIQEQILSLKYDEKRFNDEGKTESAYGCVSAYKFLEWVLE